MDINNLNDLRRLILGSWSNQGWQLEFETYESEYGKVHYYADGSHMGTMQYRIYFDAQTPILNMKEGSGHDVSYAIKEYDAGNKTLTVSNLNQQETLKFNKK